MKPTLLVFAVFLSCSFVKAQCPPNIDFETGTFNNWETKIGGVTNPQGVNTITWATGFGPTPGRHEIIPASDQSLDPFGNFPKHCPNSSGYSIQLGNQLTGREAEGAFYTFTVPANNNRFSLVYYYAIVFQDPGHSDDQQPRFIARVVDVATDAEINCMSFDFTASASLPGFQTNGDVVFRNWTPITVDLSGYAGRTVRLEFITADCTLGGHFGYAYIDVNSGCSGSIEGSSLCSGETNITLTGPYGFQSYEWYSNTSFSQLIGSSQSLVLPPSSIGSTFPLIVIPYPGFGCTDTLYATITRQEKPASVAGADQSVCYKQQVQLGGASNSNHIYSWSPVNLVSNPSLSNPLTVTQLQSPTQFIVKTTDAVTGCFSMDTVIVTPVMVDTSSSIVGKTLYCPDETITTSLSVSAGLDRIQWYRNNSAVANASSSVLNLSDAGNYWALLHQNGCFDSTRVHTIKKQPLPRVNFSMDKEVQCVQGPIVFTNKTIPGDNVPLRYEWKFSDGVFSPDVNFNRTFNAVGTYSVKLIASANNCLDSLERTLIIVKDCSPLMPTAFTPNGDGRNDKVKPLAAGIKTLKRFAIYNRYGEVVFSTNREGEAWDGTRNGKPLKTDVFVWVLEYVSKDNTPAVAKGTIMLIR